VSKNRKSRHSLSVLWLKNNSSLNLPSALTRLPLNSLFRRLTTPTIEAAFGRKVQKKEYDKIAREHQDGSAKAFYGLFVDSERCREKE